MLETTSFLGLDCIRLKNEAIELLVTQSLGPRLISLSLVGQENILAELPDLQIDCPDVGPFTFWGGHRLWHAPELNRRTYLPDNESLTVQEIEQGVEVRQPTEPQSGIQKSLRVTLPDNEARVIIDHTLKNEGLWPVDLAPWAITQLKPGGIAILPQQTAPAAGLLPDRRLALWPYTDLNSPHIRWGNRFIFIEATLSAKLPKDALKIGFPNPAGWLAYYRAGLLFVKQAEYDPEADYVDFGSSSECFCQAEFIELETLGPRTYLAPGASVTHQERWSLHPDVQFALTEEATQGIVEALGLTG
jgi:hypothetical protein